MNNNQDHHFEPIYHPEAASSDGKRRKWTTVGKNEVLTFPTDYDEKEGEEKSRVL